MVTDTDFCSLELLLRKNLLSLASTFCLARLITVAVRLTGLRGPNVLEASEIVDCLAAVVADVASAVVIIDVGVCVVAVAVGRGGLCSTIVPSGLTKLDPFSPPPR